MTNKEHINQNIDRIKNADSRELFEETLAVNIGLIAKRLRESGLDLIELDKISEQVLAFIQDKSEKATADHPLETGNVENLIVMLLMHTALTSQKEVIDQISKSLNLDAKYVESEMMKDTIGTR